MLWLMPWTPASCGGELDLGLPCGQQVPDPIAITAAPRMCAGRRLGWESEPCVTSGHPDTECRHLQPPGQNTCVLSVSSVLQSTETQQALG